MFSKVLPKSTKFIQILGLRFSLLKRSLSCTLEYSDPFPTLKDHPTELSCQDFNKDNKEAITKMNRSKSFQGSL